MSKPFLIFSLPRTGGTTLANVLQVTSIRCLIEPFHPRRYQGRYHNGLFHLATLRHRLTAIWLCWSGIKHICEPNGWPFPRLPAFNERRIRSESIGHSASTTQPDLDWSDYCAANNGRRVLGRFQLGLVHLKGKRVASHRSSFCGRRIFTNPNARRASFFAAPIRSNN